MWRHCRSSSAERSPAGSSTDLRMKGAVAADERVGVAEALVDELRKRGHEPIAHGALAEGERNDWAWASEPASRDVAYRLAEQAIVCCWTGACASIAANNVD